MTVPSERPDQLADALRLAGVDDLDVITAAAGDVVLRRGETGDDAWWVESGRVEVTGDGGVSVAELAEGALLGEFAALTGAPRAATVTAVVPTRLRRVPRETLEELLRGHPHLCAAVRAEAVRRIRATRLQDVLREMLGQSAGHLARRLADVVQVRDVPAGEVVHAAGDPAQGLLVVVSGRLRRLDAAGEAVGYLGPGSMPGHAGLTTGSVWPETLDAVRDSVVGRVTPEALTDLLAAEPRVMAPVVLGLSAGRAGARRVVDRSVALAVSPALGTPGLADAVAGEMSRLGTLTSLSSARVDTVLDRAGIAQAEPGDPGELRLLDLLARVEDDSRYVLLEPDTRATPWSRRVVSQADVLAVVTSPDPDDAEQARVAALLDAAGSRTLRVVVLWQPSGATQPTGAGAALRRWRPDHLLHVRAGSQADVARLARMLAGRPVALVLGGGSAKGFGVLGVFRALAELGVPVDAVGATSIGAALGAPIAQGLDPDTVTDTAARLFHDLLDYTLPVVSLLKGERAARSIREQLGGWAVEDLWLPYFCVSTNLTRGRPQVHRQGDLVSAVRASVAIPGAFPPVPDGDDLLVDGGVTNNLPVDITRRLYPTAEVVAVESAPATGPRAHADYGLSVSGWQALRASVGHDRRYPGMMAVLMRSMITGSMHQRDEVVRSGVIDLLLDLDMRGVGVLDFDRVREVAQTGYEQAMPRIEQWLASRSGADSG